MMLSLRNALVLTAILVPTRLAADIPATPVMTLYKFNGNLEVPYYRIDTFLRKGANSPAGHLAQGTALIPCLAIRGGKPVTDTKGTPYVGFEIVVDTRKATRVSTDTFRQAVAKRKNLKVPNHHCSPDVEHVINVRWMYTLAKAPFFDPPSTSNPVDDSAGELDRIVRSFHESDHCVRTNQELLERRDALARAWDSFAAEQKGRWPGKTLARAKHLDYTLRTALFEGHLDRGCSAYGACERNIIALSIRNRARGQCLKRQGCRFPGDFQGAASAVSQYNIWDEFLTQISGLTSCFLRKDLGSGGNARSGEYYDKLQAMYAQSQGAVEDILYGSDGELAGLFPGSSMTDLEGLRHYYHAPAMGKCFPNHERIEYMSGAVARKGDDFALIANTRIRVDDKVGSDYRFRDFVFSETPERDRIEILDRYPGFLVDGRKVRLKSPSSCLPYGVPRGCGFKEVGRYRKTPFWLKAGKALEIRCQIQARGEQCLGPGILETASVGAACDTQMRPVTHVK